MEESESELESEAEDVEKAQLKMKGSYDSKKKKQLTNKQKNDWMEKQEKFEMEESESELESEAEDAGGGSDDDFEMQLKLEAEEKKNLEAGHKKTRVDDDGVTMEFDAVKKAWFPKIDEDFIAQYQMNYGNYNTDTTMTNTTTAASSAPAQTSSSTADPATANTWQPDTNSEHYSYWYHHVYSKNPNPDHTKAFEEYYDYYCSTYYDQKKDVTKDEKSESSAKEKSDEKDEKSATSEDVPGKRTRAESERSEYDPAVTAAADKAYNDFYAYYKDLYKQKGDTEEQAEGKAQEQAEKEYNEYWCRYYAANEGENDVNENEAKDNKQGKGEDGKAEGDKKVETEEEKKAKKRKAEKDRTWFQQEEKDNTNVYVTSLPDDVTEEEFVELMNKCGLLAFDPRTRKPKVKLYRDADGKVKGDGLATYIKIESVVLALQILDGYDVRGYKISVEKAQFKMKGSYDSKKKKKKLTNKQKNDWKEKQDKLFDWRPDKLIGERPKCEKTLIIKNLFDRVKFEHDPTLSAHLKRDLETECKKYGDVKRVLVHDRHPDACASVSFTMPSEADNCKEFLHNRLFKGRTVTAETWDGKTKYTVEESEEDRAERLSRWEAYIKGDTDAYDSNPIEKDKDTPTDTSKSSTDDNDTKNVSEDVEKAEKDSKTTDLPTCDVKQSVTSTNRDNTGTEPENSNATDISETSEKSDSMETEVEKSDLKDKSVTEVEKTDLKDNSVSEIGDELNKSQEVDLKESDKADIPKHDEPESPSIKEDSKSITDIEREKTDQEEECPMDE